MAPCDPVTDATAGPSADPPAARPDAARAGGAHNPAEPPADASAGSPDGGDDDIGWRALAGSLDDLGFAAAPPAAAPPPPAAPAPTAAAAPAAAVPPVDLAELDQHRPPALSESCTVPASSGHPRARQFPRAAVTIVAVQLALALLIVAGFTTKLYTKAVIAPGGTADIEEFVEVSNHPAYASDASISLVSVRTSFAPTLFEVIGGWLDGALEVVDIADILGERTVAENRDAGRLQMDQSTQVAVAVALEHLGYEIMTPIGARIERIMPDAPAEDALREGDIVQAVDDVAITTARKLSDAVKASEPGATATLTALAPDGGTRTVTVTLADRDGVALLGVIVTTHVEFAEPPIDVTLRIENIGGPSAGLAFTLSVIDALTPEPLTGTLDVAATGTIHYDGTVGPIGGVPQKSHAVVRAGTDLFLVPASQADAAVAVAEPSVSVVGVETLQDALAAIEAHRS